MATTPVIPEKIVVHLGSPDSAAQNVTESFPSYIKNVASSEIFPGWPEEAIKANVLAQISVALNRVFTEYYRSRGFDFDITSSPAYDQTYVYGRDIYENISRIVDDIFTSYIRRQGYIEPLYAVFCDGVEVNCQGLKQWQSLSEAQSGSDYLTILKNAYGDDIEIVTDTPVEAIVESAPQITYSSGDSGREVELIQIKLNRISRNFPGIPKIYRPNGFYDRDTEEAVRTFQEVFDLLPDGIVGRATWYKINFIYNAVKNLSALNSEGLRLSEINTNYPGELREGDTSTGVGVIQYYLAYISLFVPAVRSTVVDGSFGPSTAEAVRSFQSTYGLPQTAVVDGVTWRALENTYNSILATVPYEFEAGLILPFPGRILSEGSSGNDVKALQEYLNYIAEVYPQIPKVAADGDYGPATAAQVAAFSELFGIQGEADRVNAIKWNAIINVYDDLYEGNLVNENQFPGYGVIQ